MTLSRNEVVAIVQTCRIKGAGNIRFRVGPDEDLWIQVVDVNVDEANGRKWRISEHSTKSEVVQTAFKAYLTWLEHEAREAFLFGNQPIFGPHFDVDDLWELARQGKWDVRD